MNSVSAGDLRSLLVQWQVGLRQQQISHARISAKYEQRSKWLGAAAALLAALVGTSIIGGLAEADNIWGRAVFGLLSLAAALLAALQTFLDYPTRSSTHRAAAAEFGSLRRECELMLTDTSDLASLAGRAQALRIAWSDAEKKSPPLVQSILDEIKETRRKEWANAPR
jgi:hypothetical protein